MSSPLRPALLAVERAGPQAVASLCLLADVTEAEFRAALAALDGDTGSNFSLQAIEQRLAAALGVGTPSTNPGANARFSRRDWPDTPLQRLQILRGVEAVDPPSIPLKSIPTWIPATSLLAYLLISLSYAFGLYGYL